MSEVSDSSPVVVTSNNPVWLALVKRVEDLEKQVAALEREVG